MKKTITKNLIRIGVLTFPLLLEKLGLQIEGMIAGIKLSRVEYIIVGIFPIVDIVKNYSNALRIKLLSIRGKKLFLKTRMKQYFLLGRVMPIMAYLSALYMYWLMGGLQEHPIFIGLVFCGLTARLLAFRGREKGKNEKDLECDW